MAIRIRRGKEEDLDFSKLKEAEMALTTDTKKLFFCYSPGNVKRLQTAEDLQNLLDASPEAYQALQQLIADLSANPNELANILSSISALESGKVSKADLVQTNQVSNPEKVPSSAVTHALGQQVTQLNNNLADYLIDMTTGNSPYVSGVDANDLNAGMYMGTGFLNVPTGVIWCAIWCIRGASTGAQMLIVISSTGNAQNNKIYVRTLASSEWREWVEK